MGAAASIRTAHIEGTRQLRAYLDSNSYAEDFKDLVAECDRGVATLNDIQCWVAQKLKTAGEPWTNIITKEDVLVLAFDHSLKGFTTQAGDRDDAMRTVPQFRQFLLFLFSMNILWSCFIQQHRAGYVNYEDGHEDPQKKVLDFVEFQHAVSIFFGCVQHATADDEQLSEARMENEFLTLLEKRSKAAPASAAAISFVEAAQYCSTIIDPAAKLYKGIGWTNDGISLSFDDGAVFASQQQHDRFHEGKTDDILRPPHRDTGTIDNNSLSNSSNGSCSDSMDYNNRNFSIRLGGGGGGGGGGDDRDSSEWGSVDESSRTVLPGVTMALPCLELVVLPAEEPVVSPRALLRGGSRVFARSSRADSSRASMRERSDVREEGKEPVCKQVHGGEGKQQEQRDEYNHEQRQVKVTNKDEEVTVDGIVVDGATTIMTGRRDCLREGTEGICSPPTGARIGQSRFDEDDGYGVGYRDHSHMSVELYDEHDEGLDEELIEEAVVLEHGTMTPAAITIVETKSSS